MTVSEARAKLPAILDRVREGDEVTITRHGEPVAVVVRPDTLRTRRTGHVLERARQLGAMLEAARDRPLSDEGGLSPEFAEELIAEIRAGRASR